MRADDCETASGIAVSPYYIVEYPDWVQVVAIDQHDHVLLVRQYRHGLGEFSLELPAGNMDAPERDPLAHRGARIGGGNRLCGRATGTA